MPRVCETENKSCKILTFVVFLTLKTFLMHCSEMQQKTLAAIRDLAEMLLWVPCAKILGQVQSVKRHLLPAVRRTKIYK